MKLINSIKSLLIILNLALSTVAFSSEPKMMLYKKPGKERKIASQITKSENLETFEINNSDMIKLYGFKVEKKSHKKTEKKIERNSDKKLLKNLTVEVFAEMNMKKEKLSL